jgi:formylglycine-generating enzyme required for sulfatase activity/class 3 adenylate cyclase
MTEEVTRRLAAIVMADVVGYSRLMNADERGTHQRVQRLLRELIEPTILEHRGRLVKQRGDGFLSMFDSPVEAVRCAIIIQQSMVSRNLEVPNEQAIRFRIGVNLGDVIVEADDIYGEGVNVAARLEQLAEPGNIYISGGVYEQVRYKLVCGYQSLGDQKVKNILDPIATYRVLPDPDSVRKATRRPGYKVLAYGLMGGISISLALGALYFWHTMSAPEQHSVAVTNLAVEPIAPAVAAKPIIAEKPVARESEPAASPAPAQIQEAAAAVPLRPQIEAPPAAPAPAPPPVGEPEMLAIPGGTFQMGSNEDASEQPIHRVTVKPFLLAKYPVTVRQWLECSRAKACAYTPSGNADAPVSNVSWADAQQYVTWLSQTTHHRYRLPTEAEWEYAVRGGTDTRYWWGNTMKQGFADCKGCGDSAPPVKVGTRVPNPFGVFDVNGGVTEWMEDCWFKDYRGAPADGSARLSASACREHVLRGGSWSNDQNYVRSASRDFYDTSVRYPTHGIRVARSP